jgi:hypothetical protein
MASTRNKNTFGDYRLEQNINKTTAGYSTYVSYGQPLQTHFPGNGLLAGRIVSENLSRNACDIESQLFGIGSTNLEIPRMPYVPEIKSLQSLNIIDKLPVMVPEPLAVEKNQRPYLNY